MKPNGSAGLRLIRCSNPECGFKPETEFTYRHKRCRECMNAQKRAKWKHRNVANGQPKLNERTAFYLYKYQPRAT